MSADTFDFTQGARDTLRGTLHDPAATPGDVLTVLAGGAIAAAPGGGGAAGVQVVTVPVSSAEILDLANTPVVLVPGVAGSMVCLQSIYLVYVAGSTPYTGGNIISVYTTALAPWFQQDGAGFWDQATDQVQGIGYGNGLPVAAEDVVLTADANPTLGDGTLLVTLSYFLAPTV